MLKRLSQCEACKIGVPIALLIVLGFWLAYQFVPPPVPKSLTIATGREGGAYFAYAERYRQRMQAEFNIELRLLPTAGTPEVLKALREGRADIGMAQGGLAEAWHKEHLESIAGLYLEPVWIFQRADLTLNRLFDLKGKRIWVGEEGSGTRALALSLLAANGVTGENSELIGSPAVPLDDKLARDGIDAIFLVSGTGGAMVKKLLADDRFALFHAQRQQAYMKRFAYLSTTTLGEGELDLAANLPGQATPLLAVIATLVATPDLHPIARRALLRVVIAEHGKDLPPMARLDIPINQDAQRYLQNGPGILERYLPFSAAAFIDRMKIMLVPLLTLLIPLLKSVLPIYRWRIRFKIYRWYSALKEADARVEQLDTPDAVNEELRRIRQLEEELAMQVSVPLSYMGEFYDLRVHVTLVTQRLEGRLARLGQENE